MRTNRLGIWAFAAILTMALVGCGGGESQKKVATQPNGPPKPPAAKVEPPDSERHRREALAAAVAFAQKRYAAKLDYASAEASYAGALSKKIEEAQPQAKAIPGTWAVRIKVAKVVSSEVNLSATSDADARSGQNAGSSIVARRFIVDPAGGVTELSPLEAMSVRAPTGQ